jgi:AcrR family transcriptional regulator
MGIGDGFNERVAIARKPRPREQRRDAARNHETLVRAATAAVHREGPHVSMATIAADAGVGIGTLYRHFRTREDLLNFLTHRSFEQVLANVQTAENDGTTASDALRRFIQAAITQRNELVLPLHGGPPVTAPETLAVRDQVYRAVQRIIERGRTDGTISQDVSPRDVVAFGAMLAQPRQPDPEWDATCRRLLATFVNGLSLLFTRELHRRYAGRFGRLTLGLREGGAAGGDRGPEGVGAGAGHELAEFVG